MLYPDGSLERGLIEGDPETLRQVIRWISIVLTARRCRARGLDPTDLRQETLARALESLRRGRFDPRRDLRVYLQAIARYVLREHFGRHPTAGFAAALQTTPPAAQGLERTAMGRELAGMALRICPPACRGLLQAHFLEQRSHAEIAASMGIPIGTVKSRISRCLRHLQTLVRDPVSTRRSSASGRSPSRASPGTPEGRSVANPACSDGTVCPESTIASVRSTDFSPRR